MLEISPEKVCYLIVKAHQYDVKVEPVEPDRGSNPADNEMREVLEDYADDPVAEEIKSFVADLNLDEQIDLVALLWLGRDSAPAEDWSALRTEAARAHNEHTAEYLMGTPLLGDYLSAGLACLGYSCEDYELQHQ